MNNDRYDLSHLEAIELRLSHERSRVLNAKHEKERKWREHNVREIERERLGEIEFLAKRGVVIVSASFMSDDEILAELGL